VSGTEPGNEPTRPAYVRRPGDRVVRRGILQTETVTLAQPRARRRGINPALGLVLGFAAFILIGTLILLLPFASADGSSVGITAALFTATSAVCVTGLVVLDTGTAWSGFGQAVILALIQVGGFGFMTSSTLLLLLLLGHRTSLQQRLLLGQTMGGGLPGQVLPVIKRIAIVTIVLEAVGAVILFAHMASDMPAGDALWWSVFHSISAFNNAGFDIVGGYQSLVPHHFDIWILSVIGVLAVLGGISYTVMADSVRTRLTWRRMSVDTKLVLGTTLALLIVGTAIFLAAETRNPLTLGAMGWGDRILNGVFFSTTPRTSGFTVIPIDDMHDETAFFTMALMFIGGASGSTAGGIKIQTFTLLLFAILAAMANRDRVVAFGREVPNTIVFRALAVALISIAIIFSMAMLLTVTEDDFPFIDIFFEIVSAYGTVGLSMGITPELNEWSRLIVSVTMFIGRLGPLILVLALAAAAHRTRHTVHYATESVKIG
jgi:trk system potassium uptake protein